MDNVFICLALDLNLCQIFVEPGSDRLIQLSWGLVLDGALAGSR